MPLPFQDKPAELYDNADSFAMVFDQAWRRHEGIARSEGLSTEERCRKALDDCADHPFMRSQPAMARQVAEFRIRLLAL
ncbi:MAG: hypothetical protein RLZZ219_955 [Cyanobacteriota bacterium]|jgi:hypothetical protein